MKTVSIIVLLLAAIFLIGYVGLHIKPRAFVMPALAQSETKTFPLPSGLPKPVERFYKTVYGDQIPVIDTVVLVGRGRIRPFGIWFPARFVIVHNTGHDYRHYFEATFFGMPFLRVNEGILDGESFFESPMGTYYNDPNTNQGANLALWAEGGWFPSIWVTDPRVQWEAVDDTTALLHVPYEDQIETFTVHFNPETGLIDKSEVMRFKNPGDTEKILWVTSTEAAGRTSYATWMDVGKPWAELGMEEILFNGDVSEYIRVRGR